MGRQIKWLYGIAVFVFSAVAANAQLNDDSLYKNNDSLQQQIRLRYTFKQLYKPVFLFAGGSLLETFKGAKNTQQSFYKNHLRPFETTADDYLQYAPLAVPYVLDMFGVKSKTDVANRTVIVIKTEILSHAFAYALKKTVREWRPDHSNRNSFPSGHSTEVFAAATILSEEYGHQFKWIPYASYGFATAVGMLRVANNEHYIGDVLAGAAIGILSAKVSYWTHRYKWGKKKRPMSEP